MCVCVGEGEIQILDFFFLFKLLAKAEKGASIHKDYEFCSFGAQFEIPDILAEGSSRSAFSSLADFPTLCGWTERGWLSRSKSWGPLWGT